MTELAQTIAPEHDFAEHEHRELARGIQRIHDAARMIGVAPVTELSAAVREVLTWLHADLEPHAAWEDGWLYPEIDRRAGTSWATLMMRFEHEQIRARCRAVELRRAHLREEHAREDLEELRAGLLALEAVIRAHLEREERFLIPLLERELAPA